MRAASAAPSRIAASQRERAGQQERLDHALLGALHRRQRLPHAEHGHRPAAADDRPCEEAQAARLGQVERRVPERRRANPACIRRLTGALLDRLARPVAVVAGHQLGLVGDDRAAGHSHHKEPSRLAERRLRREIATHRCGDRRGPLRAPRDGLRRKGGGVLTQVVVDCPPHLRCRSRGRRSSRSPRARPPAGRRSARSIVPGHCVGVSAQTRSTSL